MIPRALALVTAVLLLVGCASAAQPADRVQVQVLGAMPGSDVGPFTEVGALFTEQTGIDVVYTPAIDVLSQVTEPTASEPVPDMVVFDTPGVFNILASQGHLEPLDDLVDDDTLLPVLDFAGTSDGERYGLPLKVGLYNLVWYSPPEFEREGYEVPEDYLELLALMDEIKAGGRTPWCLGIESGHDTGWVLTDWLEMLVLDSAGAEAYDRWANLALPFSSPEVSGGANLFGQLIVNDEDNVQGGRIGILGNAFPNAALPMLEDPPGCLLHRQNSFFSTVWPADVVLGEDIDVFPFPQIDPAADRSLVGNTMLATLVDDSPEAEAFLEFLDTPEAGERWAEVAADGTFVSPREDFDESIYGDLGERQADILADADVFRLDGSLQMPREVGFIAFHQKMVDWVFGRATLEQTLADIDAARAEVLEDQEGED